MKGPSPEDKVPMKGFPQVGYLKNYIYSENIVVGDYTYYDDPDGPERFEDNVLYHFPFIGDSRLMNVLFDTNAVVALFFKDHQDHENASIVY